MILKSLTEGGGRKGLHVLHGLTFDLA